MAVAGSRCITLQCAFSRRWPSFWSSWKTRRWPRSSTMTAPRISRRALWPCLFTLGTDWKPCCKSMSQSMRFSVFFPFDRLWSSVSHLRYPDPEPNQPPFNLDFGSGNWIRIEFNQQVNIPNYILDSMWIWNFHWWFVFLSVDIVRQSRRCGLESAFICAAHTNRLQQRNVFHQQLFCDRRIRTGEPLRTFQRTLLDVIPSRNQSAESRRPG